MVHRYLDQIAVRLGSGSASTGDSGVSGSPRDLHALLAADAVQPGAQFIWRDRLYVVREVLAYWSESTQWWMPISAEVRGAVAASGGAGSMAKGSGSAGPSIPAVQVWRVVAGIGRRHPSGAVVDLIRDPESGRWRLARTID